MQNVKCKIRIRNAKSEMRNLPAGRQVQNVKGFSLIEIIITISLFFLLTGTGLSVYFNYYKNSIVKTEVDDVITLMKNARFKAMKNPTNSNYGIHIDEGLNQIVEFVEAYTPSGTYSQSVKLNSLRIEDLNLAPNIGFTNEIIFENKTGKTENTGSFVIGNDTFNYTFNINSQGVIN